ncbi:MAG TPA: TRAFs-binding domain-containing protein [Bryobacteraceae bacterium]
MTPDRPICFIVTPSDPVFETVIAPAAADAGLDPLRGPSGPLAKSAGEQFVLARFAVADVTAADSELHYYLGLRDALRPGSTLLVSPEGSRALQMVIAAPYRLDADVAKARQAVAHALQEMQKRSRARRLFALLELATDHTKTDVFREDVSYDPHWKQRLGQARKEGAEAVRTIEREIGDLTKTETGVLVDLLLSYRAVSAWTDMTALAGRLPPPVAATALVREQLAFALNRLQQRDEAEAVLRRLLDERGPSSETCALLGRIYKDRWEEALKTGAPSASGYLEQSIGAYLAGFEADWRDAYPGVNAVTLMELKDPPDDRRKRVLPVVRYAVERKIAQGHPDYWDYATLVELAVLAEDRAEAEKMLAETLARVREKWEPETTARNLRLIREARERRGGRAAWAEEIERTLLHAA